MKKKPIDSPFCGCMQSDVIEDFRKVLSCVKDGYKYYADVMKETGLEEKYLMALYTIADKEGLMEHGTSIRGAFITDKGLLYLEQPVDYSDEYEEWAEEAYALDEEAQ